MNWVSVLSKFRVCAYFSGAICPALFIQQDDNDHSTSMQLPGREIAVIQFLWLPWEFTLVLTQEPP